MLLFKKPFHAGLVSGAITLTFRRWTRSHVRAGGRYRCHPIGVLEVDAVELVTIASISEADAVAAGLGSREALIAYLAELGPLEAGATVHRVRLHHGGDGDRVEAAMNADLSKEDVATIREKLARLDEKHAKGAWTKKTLALIEKHPRVAASRLAEKVDRETLPFKADVVKLKKLGLTQSFEVGYELSPRGRAFLAMTRRKKA